MVQKLRCPRHHLLPARRDRTLNAIEPKQAHSTQLARDKGQSCRVPESSGARHDHDELQRRQGPFGAAVSSLDSAFSPPNCRACGRPRVDRYDDYPLFEL